jgi:hypothetical protein
LKILMMSYNDPAGTAIAMTKAINKYTEHTCRLITKEIRYDFMFEKDLHLPGLDKSGWDEVENLLETSDIFHFHMTADETMKLGCFLPKDYLKGKKIVHHHHGHPDFRGNPEKYKEKYKKLKRRHLLVSTPDLLHSLPGAKWQPNLVPINDPLYLPALDKSDNPIIIVHSPTRKDLKNTDLFMAVTKKIQKKLCKGIEIRLIENTAHATCLKQKRESHILFDHLQGYFGVSSLEGLSQGLCVFAGLDEWNQRWISEWTGCDALPWSITNPRDLSDDLMNMIEDKEKRQAAGQASRDFMVRCWSDQKTVQHLIDFYQS